MAETTLRIRTQAELKALVDYAAALKAVRIELGQVTEAQARAGGQTPGQQGPPVPASVGMPPMPPMGPGTVPGVTVTAPPGGWGGSGGGGPPGGGGGGGGGNRPGSGPGTGMGFGGGFAQGFGSPDWAHHAYTLYQREGGRAAAGYAAGTAISRTASTVQQLGLGQGIEGFLLSSGQKYLELSKIITQVNRQFREGATNVVEYGHAMGYTVGEASQLAETLGSQVNSFSSSTFKRYAGLARFAGLDAGQAMQRLGGIQELGGGGALGDSTMTGLLTQATRGGMGGGRFGEFLGTIQRLMEGGLRATGSASTGSAQLIESMTRQVFEQKTVNPATGELVTTVSPLGIGERGAGFQEQFQNVITGKANPAMRTLMMQAMGYGQKGGPTFMQAEERLAAGINDPRNISSMFQLFQRRGYNESQTYLALREAGFDEVNARQLTRSLGTKEGFARFQDSNRAMMAAGQLEGQDLSEQQKYDAMVSAGATADEASIYAKGGYAALGRSKISAGEGMAVDMESMQLDVGKDIAQGMMDARDVIKNLAATLQNLIDIDPGKLFTDATGALKELSGMLRKSSETGGAVKDAWMAPSSMLFNGNGVAGGTIHGQSAYQVQVEMDRARAAEALNAESGGGQ